MSACGATDPDYFPLDRAARYHYGIALTTMDGTTRLKHVVDTVPASRPQAGLPARRGLDGRATYYEYRADGLYAVKRARDGEAPRALDPPQLVVPTAVEPGSSWSEPGETRVLRNTGPPWETLFQIIEPVPMEFVVDSVDDRVTVPAGVFDRCLRITGRGQTNADVGNYIGRTRITVTTTDWYAPGVGMIKSVREETTDADALNRGYSEMVLEVLQR